MKVVIDIPYNQYAKICAGDFDTSVYFKLNLRNAFRSGTLLPKGHGRLIDADELKTLSYEVLVDDDNPNTEDGLSSANGIVEEDIDLAPTIIEADKE